MTRPESPTMMARLSVCSARYLEARSNPTGSSAPSATTPSNVTERSSTTCGTTWTATSVGTAM